MTERMDWNYSAPGSSNLGILSKFRVYLWMIWRKPTKVEIYKWLLAEYPLADSNLKKHLDLLAKTELLRQQIDMQFRRIKTERELLAKDIQEAKELELDTNWVFSAREILQRSRRSCFWRSDLLS